jgi:endogenous inhibitor of DNA gyrase (YacG/DUF329 family)
MMDDEETTEVCLCGREMRFDESRRHDGFCSPHCKREYDEMMSETWSDIMLFLIPPQGSA